MGGLKRKIILKDAVVFRFIVIGRISFKMCEGANQNRAYVWDADLILAPNIYIYIHGKKKTIILVSILFKLQDICQWNCIFTLNYSIF